MSETERGLVQKRIAASIRERVGEKENRGVNYRLLWGERSLSQILISIR